MGYSVARRWRRIACATASLLWLGSAAGAEPVPAEWLKNVHDGCYNSCIKRKPGLEPACDAACSCVAQQTGENMEKDEFLAADQALSRHEPPPPGLADKAQAIHERCYIDPQLN